MGLFKPSDKEIQERIQANIDVLTPYNVNPKSEIIDSFHATTNTAMLQGAIVVNPFLAFAVPVRRFIYGVLADSLLVVPENPKKAKFESIRIFWKDLDKYKLKILERPKMALERKKREYIKIYFEFEGKKFTMDQTPIIKEDTAGSIKKDIYEDFKKAANIQEGTRWDFANN